MEAAPHKSLLLLKLITWGNTNKTYYERLIAKETKNKWHQTEGKIGLLNQESISKLGGYGEGQDMKKFMDGNFVPP